ncbi:hypothetical protein [Chryseobacterium daeguense]|uniref:hypothetical protein n=1 Tax=Chryseobacterium daeguense TaxID=412438 RepID=UPI0004158F7E|nr:hypothetical protein [Chryseobacterium daeguense]
MNQNSNYNYNKERHGCVTAWLVLIILGNSLTALLYFLANNRILESAPGASPMMIYLLGFVALANVLFAAMLLQWKKLGFWGFTVTSIIALIINININLGIVQSLIGIVGVGILFAILQITKDGRSAWQNLE